VLVWLRPYGTIVECKQGDALEKKALRFILDFEVSIADKPFLSTARVARIPEYVPNIRAR